MNVTFKESESYYNLNPTFLQRESEEEEVMPTLVTLDSYIQGKNSTLKDTIQRENIERLNRLDLKRYAIRDETEKTMLQLDLNQEFSSVPKDIGELFLSCDSSDKPIALRKRIRTCTQHRISNFVSYDALSLSYRAFIFSVFSVFIPQRKQNKHD